LVFGNQRCDFREVFKAREKKNAKKFVALKKVLMENEKEGVSFVPLLASFWIFIVLFSVSNNGVERAEDFAATKTRKCCAFNRDLQD
jgi:hypothetical protein